MKFAGMVRLIWIDAMLSAGSFSTPEMMEAFGISRATVTLDVAAMAKLHDGSFQYDRDTGRYVSIDDYVPVFPAHVRHAVVQAAEFIGPFLSRPVEVGPAAQDAA